MRAKCLAIAPEFWLAACMNKHDEQSSAVSTNAFIRPTRKPTVGYDIRLSCSQYIRLRTSGIFTSVTGDQSSLAACCLSPVYVEHFASLSLGLSSGVASIYCEEGQSWKLGHGALTVNFKGGRRSCAITNSCSTDRQSCELLTSAPADLADYTIHG